MSATQFDSEMFEDENLFQYHLIVQNISLFNEKTGDISIYPSLSSQVNCQNQINIGEIVNFFVSNSILPPDGAIFWYNIELKIYFYALKLPKVREVWIDLKEIYDEQNDRIYLKYRPKLEIKIYCPPLEEIFYQSKLLESQTDVSENKSTSFCENEQVLDTDLFTDLKPDPPKSVNLKKVTDGRSKRHRERTIQEAEDLVTKWHALNKGGVDQNSKKIAKLTLKDAAARLGVPKKSLDDYLLMIRHGRKFGFDFASNMNKGFGVLRKFLVQIKKTKKIDE